MLGAAPQKLKKRATNVTIREDLWEQAKAMQVNVSATLEVALVAELKRLREARWQDDNREAIEAYNAFVAEHGVFGDETGTW